MKIITKIKSLFCEHGYEFIRNVFGDEIIRLNGKRSIWKCKKCGKYHYSPFLEYEYKIITIPVSPTLGSQYIEDEINRRKQQEMMLHTSYKFESEERTGTEVILKFKRLKG